jgi:predicted acetyltransferase
LIDEFTFQHLETSDDIEQYLNLMRAVFGKNSNVDLQVRKWIDHRPGTTLKDFFVIKRHCQIVACLNLLPSEWSIGGVPLKVAELSCVATLPQFRHRGLQRRLMNEYHSRITTDKYDLSAIEGIPYFYRQFGYEYALPLEEETRINVDKIPEYETSGKIRPLVESDIPEAKKLLARAQEKFYVHSVRNDGIWRMQEKTHMIAEQSFRGYVIEEKGQIVAYFRVSENKENKELCVREITNVDQRTAESILRFLKDAGMKNGFETLISRVSYLEPFTRQLMATGHAEQSLPYAWQIHVLNYADTLSKMKNLFEERLSKNNLSDLTQKLNLNLYRYTIQITFENGMVTSVQRFDTSEDRVIRFNPVVFVQLLLGYRSREELETVYPDFLVKPGYKSLVDVLFPKMPSFIHTNY